MGAPDDQGGGEGLAEVVAARLPQGPSRIAVLEGSNSAALSRALASVGPDVLVVTYSSSLSLSDRHVQMTAAGPFDVIVDDHAPPGRAIRFQSSFFHLRPGGVMVVRRGAGELVSGREGRLGRLLAKAADARAGARADVGAAPGRHHGDVAALAEAVVAQEVTGPHLILTNGVADALVKLRESETNAYLELAPSGRDRVVTRLPAEDFVSRGSQRDNTDHPDLGGELIRPIELSLREYHDATVMPGQIVRLGRVLVADTFRHNQSRRLENHYTRELAPRFARLPQPLEDVPRLRGDYFHLDNEVRGHFGHLMTEQLSRLWAWDLVKQEAPAAKAVMCLNKNREIRDWEYEVYRAAGIRSEDIMFLRESAQVERLFSSSPMLSNPEYVHPRIAEVWRTVGQNLLSSSTGSDLPRRFFCSRRLAKRACTNAAEVEALFERWGFATVFPEDLALGDQVRLFQGAEVIAGFAGSGLFNLCFVERPVRVITVCSTSYGARNEYLMAAVWGHQIDTVVCQPDRPQAFHSTYSFDHDREGPYLTHVLESLGRSGATHVQLPLR